MPEDDTSGFLKPIIIAIVIALLVGGTSPWWWKEFVDNSKEPEPEYAWHKHDHSGQPYIETFTHNTGKGRAREVHTGVYKLSDSDGRIYRVDFQHKGANKAWNYHRTNGPPLEYEGDTEIFPDGKSFLWRRIWQGADVTEIYSAYYEVWRTK